MKKILTIITIVILSTTISLSQLLSPTLTNTLETSALSMNFGVGMIVPYVITIHNPNPNDDLFDVVIIDNLPVELQLMPAISDFVSSGIGNQCELPNLITVPGGASISYHLFAVVIAPLCDMTISNCATITEGSYGEYPVTACWQTSSPNTLVINATIIDEICDCDGAIMLGVSGGIPPVTFMWNNGETTQSIYNLCNNSYSFTVTDDLGCEEIGSVPIDAGSDLYIKSWGGTEPTSCSTNDGTIDVDWLGNSPSYTAILLKPDGTPLYTATVIGTPPLTQYTFNNVPQGLYNIVIVDNTTGCSENFAGLTGDEIWVDISLDNGIDFSINQTNPTCCYSDDGSISVTNVVNSYGYVFYSWSNGETTSSISNLTAGTYFVTVSDIQFCTKVKMIELICPDIPQVEIEHTNPNCVTLNAGTIDFNCTNYTNWTYEVTGPNGYINIGNSPGPISLNGLYEGFYNIAITVGNCTYSYPCQLTQLKLEFRMTVIDCSVYSAGLLELIVQGGVQPLSFQWTFNGMPYAISQSNNVIEFFPNSGTYCVTVTDALGCTASLCETYNPPSCALDVSLEGFHPTCTNSNNGQLTANASCGVPPYYYFWSIAPDSSFITTINGLEVNTNYSVTVKDHHGCLATDDFYLNDFDLMYLTAEITDESCNSPNSGAIDLTVVSGIPPFTYNWSNGAITQDITGLAHGTYYVTVTDDSGCEITGEYDVRLALVLSWDVIGQGCDGIYNNPSVMLTNGSIDLTVTGGTTPYTYAWSNGAVTEDLSGLTDGSILNVTVSDINGCYGYAEIEVGSDQTIELDAGWNFMSTYIDPFNTNVTSTFIESDILPYVNIIKDNFQNENDYYNTLTNLPPYSIGEGYKIKMDYACDYKITGTLVCPEDNEIILSVPTSPNEEWIGYLRKVSQPVNDVFSSVVNDVMIVNEENGLVWWPAYNYYGFTTMYPDEGYNVIMSNPNSIFYDPNPDAFGTKSIINDEQAMATYLKLNNTENFNTSNSMVLGITQGAWDNLPDIGDEIGVYSPEGNLIGRNVFTGGHTGIVIYGDDESTEQKEAICVNEEFTIRVWNRNTNKEYEIKITDWLVGNNSYKENSVSIADALKVNMPKINSDEDLVVETYPNPTSGNSGIRISTILAGHLGIELLSIEGKTVKQLTDTDIDKGTYLFKFDFTNLDSGSYFYRITINNKIITKKIILSE